LREATRRRVAELAARLLYRRRFREYKPAKEEAARLLHLPSLPSNREVATELDRLADACEGVEERRALLRFLRGAALKLMVLLKDHAPRLIGSVWRGTARRGSDVDLEVFTDDPVKVIALMKSAYGDLRVVSTTKTAAGTTSRYLHVKVPLTSHEEAEVIVKGSEHLAEKRRCDIYGDRITGLSLPQLAALITRDPTRRFVP
jgi:predicted nucleotidyltransferase